MIDTSDMQIIQIDPHDLIPYNRNIRRHTETDLDIIRKSVSEFGFRDPVTVDPNMVIIEGHGRVQVALEMGLTEIPVIISDLEGEAADRYRVVHNKTGEIAGYDMELYDEVIADLEKNGFDAEGYMFTLPDVDEVVEDVSREADAALDDLNSGGGGDVFKFVVICESDGQMEDAIDRLSDMEGIVVKKV